MASTSRTNISIGFEILSEFDDVDNNQTRSLIIVFIQLKVELYQVQLGMHLFRNHRILFGQLAEYDELCIKGKIKKGSRQIIDS